MQFAFSDFVLDTQRKELAGARERVALTRQTYELLCFFVENAGRVVSRDELIEKVWRGRIVTDNTVDQSVSKLRRTLNAAHPGEYIEALYGQGFRFVPPVRSGPLASTPPRRPGRWRYVALTALLAALLFGLWLGLRSDPAVSPGGEVTEVNRTDPRPAVAVLPLRDQGAADGAASLTDGMHEEVLSQLSRIGSLRVISRTSVMRYRETDEPLPSIARALGVDALVEGSVQQNDDQIRITINLVDAATDTSLWAETFDRRFTTENLFEIQSDIATAVATALDAELTAQDEVRLARRPTDNLEAYQSFLLGRHHFNNRLNGEVDMLDRAESHYRRALELAPDYAEAHAGLALVYAVFRDYSQQPLPAPARQLAIQYAQSALALDPALAAPHAVLGMLAEDATSRHFHLQAAIELEPYNTTALLWAGEADLAAGFPYRAEERLLAARSVDPTSPSVTQWLAIAAYLRGDEAAAVAYAEQGLAMGFLPAKGMLSVIHFWHGRRETARSFLKDVIPEPERADWLRVIAPAAPNGTPTQEMIDVVLGPDDGATIPHFRILFLFAIGAIDEGYALIERRLDHGGAAFGYAWQADHPVLREHPLFTRFAQRLGLPEYWASTGFPDACAPDRNAGFRCD